MLIFWEKNADMSKIKGVLVLKSIFSETAFLCVLTYRISGLLFCMALFCHTNLFCMISTFWLTASTKLFRNKENQMAAFYISSLVQSVLNVLNMILNKHR